MTTTLESLADQLALHDREDIARHESLVAEIAKIERRERETSNRVDSLDRARSVAEAAALLARRVADEVTDHRANVIKAIASIDGRVTSIASETMAQTQKLDALLDADEDRKRREKFAAELVAKREAKRDAFAKWLKFILLLITFVGVLYGVATRLK